MLVLKVNFYEYELILCIYKSFLDPRKFNMYDTNRDGLVDAPEYAQGERMTEHRCKYFISRYIQLYDFFFIDGF